MAPSGWLQDRSDRARGPPRTIDLAEGMRGSADGVAWYSGGRRIRSTATATPMLYPRRRRHRPPKPDRRRALELLAASPDGCTEALMLANGFTVEMLVELIRTELATARQRREAIQRKSSTLCLCRKRAIRPRSVAVCNRPPMEPASSKSCCNWVGIAVDCVATSAPWHPSVCFLCCARIASPYQFSSALGLLIFSRLSAIHSSFSASVR